MDTYTSADDVMVTYKISNLFPGVRFPVCANPGAPPPGRPPASL